MHFSKDDILNLLDVWALSIEITSDVSNLCERLGCDPVWTAMEYAVWMQIAGCWMTNDYVAILNYYILR